MITSYVEHQIEKKLKQLQELDDRYEEEDRILESWQMHDMIEYKIKFEFYMERSKMSLLNTCDNFK